MTLNNLKFQTTYLSLDGEFYDMTDPTPLDDPYLDQLQSQGGKAYRS